ncbi:MAG: hypothetical protein WAK17_01615, partial [Candidatus Nitrosopolaris sp.]
MRYSYLLPLWCTTTTADGCCEAGVKVSANNATTATIANDMESYQPYSYYERPNVVYAQIQESSQKRYLTKFTRYVALSKLFFRVLKYLLCR